jgi:hypothetical protein
VPRPTTLLRDPLIQTCVIWLAYDFIRIYALLIVDCIQCYILRSERGIFLQLTEYFLVQCYYIHNNYIRVYKPLNISLWVIFLLRNILRYLRCTCKFYKWEEVALF